ncbi:tape measure protein [Bosea beijingensis]|uniref:tape measure protein n=1 Tax=Bosea beijingensis TaxID=3068632 RepID=UPI003BEEF8A8
MTKSQGALNAVYPRAFDISQNTRTSTSGTIELYARLQKSTRGMGCSANTLLGVTETVNQTLATTPGPAGSAEAALLLLSQGMASVTLRGEELNSVMEQAPHLAQLIADGMGIPIGSL